MNLWRLKQAATAVAAGGVIAYPTEAVFGLGCNPLAPSAVFRLLELKKRSVDDGLIVIAASLEQIESLVILPIGGLRQEILSTWPGPVTWILPAHEGIPAWLTGVHSTLAVRFTAHPLARALCGIVGPLVSTSANPSGKLPARNAMRVRHYFCDELDFILPGNTGVLENPTEIRSGVNGRIIRPRSMMPR